MDSPYFFTATRSPVEPAAAPSNSSARSHARCPSSSSSIMSGPDSPVMPSKSTLHDLLEDPAELDDSVFDTLPDFRSEPMCICDTTFCEHRQMQFGEAQPRPSFATEWTLPDDAPFDERSLAERSSKRRRSGDMSSDGIASRISRHLRRFSRHQSVASVSGVGSRSVSHSRSSSVRVPFTAQSAVLSSPNEPYSAGIAAISPASSQESHASYSCPHSDAQLLQLCTSMSGEAPIERVEPVRTPLLPPFMGDSEDGKITSPLQLPSVAPPGLANYHGIPTPPLSAKPSMSSLGQARPGHVLHPTSEIPPLAISEETDPWAIKLGHANFHILPEPYSPHIYNIQSCRRLLDDWESARREYMRQAARVCEHYGQTSQTYKLTEEKWAEIDAQWRANHEQANALAEASGESPLFQPLAETKPLCKIPSLTDPQQPSKFLAVDEADIVGPMVQYAKIQHQNQHQHRPSASRKSGLFKLFTDPSSLLTGRSASSSRS